MKSDLRERDDFSDLMSPTVNLIYVISQQLAPSFINPLFIAKKITK